MPFKSIHDQFWIKPDNQLLSPTTKLLFLYFITNPYGHFSGIYYMPLSIIKEETGLSDEEIAIGIDILSKKCIKIDTATKMVFVRKMLYWQTNKGNLNDKQKKGVVNHLKVLARSPLIRDFLKEYPQINYIDSSIHTPIHTPIDTPKQKPIAKPEKNITEDSTEYKLASLLLSAILKWKPNFKKPTDAGMIKWAEEIERAIRIDGRTEEGIKAVIMFATTDPFWQANILSGRAIREKYDQLEGQMGRKYNKPKILEPKCEGGYDSWTKKEK